VRAPSRGAARLVPARQGRAVRPAASRRGGVVAMVRKAAAAVGQAHAATRVPWPAWRADPPWLLGRTSRTAGVQSSAAWPTDRRTATATGLACPMPVRGEVGVQYHPISSMAAVVR
jgi:hypothetical protein